MAMRITVGTAGTLLLAAAVCGYLLHQLQAERGRTTAARAEVAVLHKQIEALGAKPATTVKAPDTPAMKPPVPPALPVEEDEYRRLLKSVDVGQASRQYEQFMADLDSTDPAVHRKVVDEYVSSMRYSNPRLAEGLHLTADQEQELLETLAEAELRAIKAHSAHPVAGDVRDSIPVWLAEQRRQVMELRSQLNGRNSLSDDQATHLIAAVREERERYIARSMQQAGARDAVPEGPVYVLSAYEAGSPLDMQFREAQLKRSEDFVRRLHDRAARILNPEQLRRFDELHAARLSAERFNMERFRDDP